MARADQPPLDPAPRGLTRRRVLLAGGAVAATGVLGAGAALLQDRAKRFLRDARGAIPDHRVAVPATTPRMVIARGADPARNVRAAVQRMGGLAPFIGRDDVVLIKPNIGWARTPEQGANTHPLIVAELVRLCLEARPARVVVSDCPVRRSRSAFVRSGILEAATRAGAEVVIPEDSRHVVVRLSERLGTWDVLEPFVTATKLINVPVAKHHELTGFTAGMKNWIGITNKLRAAFHEDIQRSIAELAALMRPTLTVLDATRVLMQHGPAGGSLDDVKAVNTVVVGLDPVAVDAWAFAALGVAADAVPGYLEIAQGLGLGRRDFEALAPVEILSG